VAGRPDSARRVGDSADPLRVNGVAGATVLEPAGGDAARIADPRGPELPAWSRASAARPAAAAVHHADEWLGSSEEAAYVHAFDSAANIRLPGVDANLMNLYVSAQMRTGELLQPIIDPGSVRKHVLDNGLTVLIREDRSAPVVAIVTYVKAGYFDESDDVIGISHVLEHMFFKGTPTRGPGVIAQQTKAAGGYLNAATIYDHTSYYTVLPSSSLEQGLDIQSDALLRSVIDADELRKELLVIIEEAKRKLDNPGAVSQETLFAEMFDRHRMRRWRIGTEEQLKTFTRDHLVEYYRRMYRAPEIVLAIAGDVDTGRTLDLVEKYYAALDPRPAERDVGPAEPEHDDYRVYEMGGDIVQLHLEMGWRTPDALHDDTPVLDLIGVMLGQGRASRLYRYVRDAGLVNSIVARNYTPTEIGVFGISAELQPEEALPALEAISTTISAFNSGPIAEDELERARSISNARFLRRLETVEGQANLLAEWQALGGWQLAEEYRARIAAVTLDDIRRVAARYVDPARASNVLYRPAQASVLAWSAERLRETLLGAHDVDHLQPARAPVPTPPRATTVQSRVNVDGACVYSLDNGATVVVQRRPSAPLVTFSIAACGGVLNEDGRFSGLTALMARTSVKGTRTRDANLLAEQMEALGGSIVPSVGADSFDWSCSLPSTNLEKAFDLVADAALHSAFPDAEFENERRIALNDLEQLRDDMYRYPLRLFTEAAFAGHAYGTSLEAVEVATRGFTPEHARRWHEMRVIEAPLSAFIVGDVDPDRAADIAARYLRVRPGLETGLPARARWPERFVQAVAERQKKQTALVLGFPGPARNDDDVHVLQVMSNVLSGLGGRLFEELRSRRSLAYTVAAYPVARLLGGAYVTYIATAPEREDEARNGLLEELERVRQDLLNADDVERAKRYTIGAWQIRNQTNSAQAANLQYAFILGRGMAEIREFESRISAVTPERIREAAQRWLDPERRVEGIVRGTGGTAMAPLL